MKKLRLFTIIAVCTTFCLGNSDCQGDRKQSSSSGAQQVSTIFKVPKNSMNHTVEQQNIIGRLKITTNPTKVLWIHLIALNGKIIRRMPVRNKVTSSGKRLEPRVAANGFDHYPEYGDFETNEFIQPDGTFGGSDNYIFWFDPMGRYHQWGTAGGLGYLVTDYPIDLKNPVDEITGLYRMHTAAKQWQEEQEAALKEAEKARMSLRRQAAARTRTSSKK